MSNEVEIVVKSNDRTDFAGIGAKARTSIRDSVKGGLDDVEKTTNQRFKKIGDESGKNLGHSLTSQLHQWSEHVTQEVDVKVKTKFREVGDHSGRSFTSGLKGALGGVDGIGADAGTKLSSSLSKTASEGAATAGLTMMGALSVLLIGTAPAIGALLASGIVLAFGAGLAGLGMIAAFHLKSVQKEFKSFSKDFKSFAKDISEPFADTWKTTFGVARDVMKTFQGPLKSAMKDFIAPTVSRFVVTLGEAFKKLEPAIRPMAQAFSDLVDAIGPRLPDIFKSISDALIGIANTISSNPDLFADLIVGLIQLIPLALRLVGALAKVFTWLNDHRKGLEDAGKAFMALVSPIGMAVAAFHKIKDAAKSAWDFISKFGGKGVHFVLSAVNKVDGPAKAAIKAAKGFAKGAYRALLTAHETVTAVAHVAQAVARRFAKATYRAALTAHNAVGSVVSAAASACRGFAKRMYRANLTAMNRVGEALRAAIAMGENWAHRVFTATFNVIKSIIPGVAHGGIIGGLATGGMPRGMAGGGPGGSLTWVGEQGAELVRLPTGSQVYPHGQSKGMADQMGGGSMKVEVEWVGGGGGDPFFQWIRENIRIRVGSGPNSVQKAFGG